LNEIQEEIEESDTRVHEFLVVSTSFPVTDFVKYVKELNKETVLPQKPFA
jgi:hypothetical protein